VLGSQLPQTAVAAPRMVDDERVERPECLAGGRDDARRGVRLREVGLRVGREVAAAPRERLVV